MRLREQSNSATGITSYNHVRSVPKEINMHNTQRRHSIDEQTDNIIADRKKRLLVKVVCVFIDVTLKSVNRTLIKSA